MSIVTAIVLAVGLYFTAWFYPQKIAEAKSRFDRFNRQAQQLDGIETEYYTLEKAIKEKQDKINDYQKEFVKDDSFAKTYDYLNSILKYIGPLDFSMTFAKTEKDGSFGYNVYSIRGEGPFSSVIQFISYIEKGPRLYRIENLNFQSLEMKDDESKRIKLRISFQMEMRVYFTDFEDLPPIQKSLRDVQTHTVSNPFYPHIFRNVPGNAENLIEVERAQVKAILTDKALIEYNGETHVLKVGDKVYLGHLSKIIPSSNEVKFVLNKGGIMERVSLKLQFDESEE